MSSMLESVRAIESKEEVPLAYAIDKYARSRGLVGRRDVQSLIKLLGEDLQIRRSKGWKCNKHRVDAMDWLLWADLHEWEWKEREREEEGEQERLYASGKSPYRTSAEANAQLFRKMGLDIGWRPDDQSQTDCTGVQTASPNDKDTVTSLLETLQQMEGSQDSPNAIS